MGASARVYDQSWYGRSGTEKGKGEGTIGRTDNRSTNSIQRNLKTLALVFRAGASIGSQGDGADLRVGSCQKSGDEGEGGSMHFCGSECLV